MKQFVYHKLNLNIENGMSIERTEVLQQNGFLSFLHSVAGSNYFPAFSFPNILCTINLAISYVSHLYVLIFVQCRTISNAMTRTGS